MTVHLNELKMGTGGIEPPADGLEPSILPLNYAPFLKIKIKGL